MGYCVFFGHSDAYLSKSEEQELESAIIKFINLGCTEFYNGGYGSFDRASALKVKELKKSYDIKNYLVLTYLNKKYDEYELEDMKTLYDGTIFPDIENCPPRWAISHKNQWLIKNADYVIFYLNHLWGRTGKIYRYAKKHNIKFINVAENADKLID